MAIIAPSILSADFTVLGREIRNVEQGGADWIHIDVMDGRFVPNITYGPIIVEAARRSTDLPLDVHLMIASPDAIIPEFIKAGADLVSVHVETCPHLHRTVQLIKKSGVKAGVVLNPATSPQMADYIMTEVDFVLVMSVNPGFGGQKFIESSIEKIAALYEKKQQVNRDLLIEVDGGIDENTIERVSKAGADAFVAGSSIFRAQSYKEKIELLKREAENGKTS